MCGAQEEASRIARLFEETRGARQFEENLLESILNKRVIAGAVQQEGVQSIGVGVVNLFKREGHSKGGRVDELNLFRKNDRRTDLLFRPNAEARA